MFSSFGLHWGSPPRPITWETIWLDMTPEQIELLRIKCSKQDVRVADLTFAAVQACVSAAFGKKPMLPSDILDAQLGYKIPDTELPTEGKDAYSPSERRKSRYAKWNKTDAELANWLSERNRVCKGGYELSRFFTEKELESLGICPVGGND